MISFLARLPRWHALSHYKATLRLVVNAENITLQRLSPLATPCIKMSAERVYSHLVSVDRAGFSLIAHS